MEPKTKLPKGGSAGKKSTISVEIEAHGFEDAAEKVELMADAIDSLPATVNIKAKDCEVNVHTTNIIEPKETFKTYAPGGVIRPKPDYEPEAEMIDRLILKLPPSDREKELTMLARIKNICESRSECEGCWYNICEKSGMPYCTSCVLSGIPANWKL